VHGEALPVRIRETGRTGFYCRVLSPGPLAAGSVLTREMVGSLALPEALRLWSHDRKADDPALRGAAIARLLAEPALGERWREVLEENAKGG
jgi:MOSC domain-containing protein YiiM